MRFLCRLSGESAVAVMAQQFIIHYLSSLFGFLHLDDTKDVIAAALEREGHRITRNEGLQIDASCDREIHGHFRSSHFRNGFVAKIDFPGLNVDLL